MSNSNFPTPIFRCFSLRVRSQVCGRLSPVQSVPLPPLPSTESAPFQKFIHPITYCTHILNVVLTTVMYGIS